ncbi:hypothetical protein Bca52824_002128 [Brassica carinata]|uniref:Uncharacterized protein n=1 Tax=Brassica carinata TaxID=52824 RepID=A0A8X7WHD1_BRACI|nr:hypothetical protein Bca52824_002128 [Brassica carinata]
MCNSITHLTTEASKRSARPAAALVLCNQKVSTLAFTYFTFYGMMAVGLTPNQHLAAVISSTLSGFLLQKPMPQDHLHADRIIEAMIGAGDFSDWASDFLFAVEDQVEIPLSTSVFIPTDFDTADVSSTNGGRRLSVAWWDFQPQNLRKRERRRSKPR